jgi:hypothetical protein
MNEFLSFRKMITPAIIQIIFWIGILAVLIAGIMQMLLGGIGLLTGLVTWVVGAVMVRIYCELLILMFRIYDVLKEIRDKP